MGKPLRICYKRLDCDLSRAQAFKYESRADCDAAGPFGVVCGGSPSLERLSCCKYPRRWLWLCGFWVLDDSSLRWHRSGTINGFFRPQFALAEALTWSMRLDMRLFHTVARLHSFVCCFFGLWWKKSLPLLKLRLIHMRRQARLTLCNVLQYIMSVKSGYVCSLMQINQW